MKQHRSWNQRLLERFLEKKKTNQRQQKRDPIKHQQRSLQGSASVDNCAGSGAQTPPSPVSFMSERGSGNVNIWGFIGNEQFQGLGWATDACAQSSAAT